MTPPIVKRYLVALDRHKWAGLTGFVVVVGLSGVVAFQPKPPENYVAYGLMTYSDPPVTLSQTGLALRQQGRAVSEEGLLSNYVINAAAEKLAADPDDIRRHASVEVDSGGEDGGGFRIKVIYEDLIEEQSEAQTTERVAELTERVTELMKAMEEQSREFNRQQLIDMRDNLQQLQSEVDKDVQEAEQNLQKYVRQQGPALQAAREGDIVGAITSSQSQRRQIQYALEGLDAQISSLESRLGLTADQAYTSSALSADPIIADLRGQIYQAETQMQIMSQNFRPDHPSMVELRNQHQAFEQLLQQRVNEVLGGNQIAAPLPSSQIRQDSSLDPARQQLANTLVGLQTQRDTLQQQLITLNQSEQQLRQQYVTIPDLQLQQSRLEQELALKRSFYDQIQARLEDVILAEKETVGNLIIIQNPEANLVAETEPSSLIVLLVGGFVGLLVGGGLVLLLDSLDATFHTLQDVQAALRQQEVPVLGLLPLLPVPEDDRLPLVMEADSPYIEPYERFRSNLRRAAGGKALKIVLITSTMDGEGKTLSAYNLAIASARAGKRTLLIEADLRSPSQAKSLKVTLDPDSVLEPLRYYGHLSECIRLVPDIENLYLLPCPGAQRQATAILESSEMRRVLEDARGRFDLVILDTPALSRYNDALILEPYSDGLVLVTRPGYTEEGLLTEAVEQFTEAEDIQFLGAIINGADIPIQSAPIDEIDDQYTIENLESQDLQAEDIERVSTSSGRV